MLESSSSETVQDTLESLYELTLPPLLELSDMLSKTLNPIESAVFKLNTLSAMLDTLFEFEMCKVKYKELESMTKEYIHLLVNVQVIIISILITFSLLLY